MVHGAWLMFPLSAIRRPWFGSNRLVVTAPAGFAQGSAAARLPGPETLRTFSSKSSTSSRIAE